jgi:hypothetical protein
VNGHPPVSRVADDEQRVGYFHRKPCELCGNAAAATAALSSGYLWGRQQPGDTLAYCVAHFRAEVRLSRV